MSLSRLYQQLKNQYHFLQAHFWRFVYGRPDIGMKLYGVTGTNGKTTTCYLLTSVLAKAEGIEKVGMLTTISMRVGNTIETNETKLTTLPSKLVYQYLKRMKEAGVRHVALEITSHALDQNRLAGIRLAGAIVTHIEREHLNYHQTMEGYIAAKAKIANYLLPEAPLVVKSDNEWTKRLGQSVQRQLQGAQLIWFRGSDAKEVQISLSGEVNKENALAVQSLATAIGYSKEDIQAGLRDVTSVPGRMEEVPNSRGIRILIDYAVTSQALESLYKNVKASTQGKVFAILGAAGLRDRGKRADMARVVARYADLLIITREDPWTEDEEQIFQDLEQGLDPAQKGVSWDRIVDRVDALKHIFAQAKSGDVIVATGKGAETGMGIGKDIVPYSERETIEKILKNHGT